MQRNSISDTVGTVPFLNMQRFFETCILVKKLTLLVISIVFMGNSCFNMFKLAFFKISLIEAMEIKSHEADCQIPSLQLRV